jgi:hypothetical protein
MSLVKQLAFRDGRITGVHITPGKGGIQTQIKLHAPIDHETAEVIGARTEELDAIESVKLRFRLIGTKASFVGAGNLQKFRVDIEDCEATNFTLKPTGDLSNGNAKSQVVHVVYTVAFNRSSPELHAFLDAVGDAPLLIKMKGDAEAEQQELPLDPEKAAAAAKKARERAGGVMDPKDALKLKYDEILKAMKDGGAEMPGHTTPLANANKLDLARVAKKAADTSEQLGEAVTRLVNEVIELRGQADRREQLKKV